VTPPWSFLNEKSTPPGDFMNTVRASEWVSVS